MLAFFFNLLIKKKEKKNQLFQEVWLLIWEKILKLKELIFLDFLNRWKFSKCGLWNLLIFNSKN